MRNAWKADMREWTAREDRIAERREQPTLLDKQEADAMASYLRGKDRDGLQYWVGNMLGRYVVEMRDAEGRLLKTL